jgi:hypothetical protein
MGETWKLGTSYHSLENDWWKPHDDCILTLAGEAQAGSAGEQPAQE